MPKGELIGLPKEDPEERIQDKSTIKQKGRCGLIEHYTYIFTQFSNVISLLYSQYSEI